MSSLKGRKSNGGFYVAASSAKKEVVQRKILDRMRKAIGQDDFSATGRTRNNRHSREVGAINIQVPTYEKTINKALMPKYSILSWGSSSHGQLGLGDTSCRVIPTRLAQIPQLIVDNDFVKQVSCGDLFSVMVTEKGFLYEWGGMSIEEQGKKQNILSKNPKKRLDKLPKVEAVACGSNHISVLTSSGKLYTWGQGNEGRLGHGSEIDIQRPKMVRKLANQKILQVSCGEEHTLILDSDGDIFSFGNGRGGQLGLGDFNSKDCPSKISRFSDCNISLITCGMNHSCAITMDGDVFSWGWGENGRLGHGDEDARNMPTMISAFHKIKIAYVSCGGAHSLMLSDDKKVYSCGWGIFGQLGNKQISNGLIPKRIKVLDKEKICSIFCGYAHSLAVSDKGVIFSWGFGEEGQLGHGIENNDSVPRIIKHIHEFSKGDSSRILAVGLGRAHSIVVWTDESEKEKNCRHKRDIIHDAAAVKIQRNVRTFIKSRKDEKLSKQIIAQEREKIIRTKFDEALFEEEQSSKMKQKLNQLKEIAKLKIERAKKQNTSANIIQSNFRCYLKKKENHIKKMKLLSERKNEENEVSAMFKEERLVILSLQLMEQSDMVSQELSEKIEREVTLNALSYLQAKLLDRLQSKFLEETKLIKEKELAEMKRIKEIAELELMEKEAKRIELLKRRKTIETNKRTSEIRKMTRADIDSRRMLQYENKLLIDEMTEKKRILRKKMLKIKLHRDAMESQKRNQRRNRRIKEMREKRIVERNTVAKSEAKKLKEELLRRERVYQESKNSDSVLVRNQRQLFSKSIKSQYQYKVLPGQEKPHYVLDESCNTENQDMSSNFIQGSNQQKKTLGELQDKILRRKEIRQQIQSNFNNQADGQDVVAAKEILEDRLYSPSTSPRSSFPMRYSHANTLHHGRTKL